MYLTLYVRPRTKPIPELDKSLGPPQLLNLLTFGIDICISFVQLVGCNLLHQNAFSMMSYLIKSKSLHGRGASGGGVSPREWKGFQEQAVKLFSLHLKKMKVESGSYFFQLGILFILIYQIFIEYIPFARQYAESPFIENVYAYIFFILNFYFRSPCLLPEWYMTFFSISLSSLLFLT